jgi:hypothetical protein
MFFNDRITQLMMREIYQTGERTVGKIINRAITRYLTTYGTTSGTAGTPFTVHTPMIYRCLGDPDTRLAML